MVRVVWRVRYGDLRTRAGWNVRVKECDAERRVGDEMGVVLWAGDG